MAYPGWQLRTQYVGIFPGLRGLALARCGAGFQTSHTQWNNEKEKDGDDDDDDDDVHDIHDIENDPGYDD
eukprot:1713885-Karenia_brevis.AAC.1